MLLTWYLLSDIIRYSYNKVQTLNNELQQAMIKSANSFLSFSGQTLRVRNRVRYSKLVVPLAQRQELGAGDDLQARQELEGIEGRTLRRGQQRV